MKFLQHGDSVVSLRFKFQEVPRGIENAPDSVPEADSFEGLMGKVETGLDLVRSGEMTSEQAADAQITLLSLSRDYASQPLTESQQSMIADLDTAARGILSPSEVFVSDTEIGNPELDGLSTDAINALTRILTIESGEDASTINAADLKIVEDFAEALERSADSPAVKNAYAQAMSNAIENRFPQFIGRLAALSQPRNLRNVVSDMLAELKELKVSEVEALKPKVNLELADLMNQTEAGLNREIVRPQGGEITRAAVATDVRHVRADLKTQLASFEADAATLGASAMAGFNPDQFA